jgi:putative endonuclease
MQDSRTTYFVYIVASASRVIYTGISSELQRRVWEHKTKQICGFVTQYNCTRLVYFEEFTRAEDAIAREKEIKGWLRRKKIALIERTNGTWKDLAWGWFDAEALRCAQGDTFDCRSERSEESHNRFRDDTTQ